MQKNAIFKAIINFFHKLKIIEKKKFTDFYQASNKVSSLTVLCFYSYKDNDPKHTTSLCTSYLTENDVFDVIKIVYEKEVKNRKNKFFHKQLLDMSCQWKNKII
ncbi:hypothetical protein BpHYR1_001179 [Brachionus plicatilis]|uniref:Uncharacterized protein n=1 Tax=Brachionus plicatilis TaxID=10195 RepID=A0A3M7SMM5_BRAPC|nr:hypothetical protein BpHYR1_001179 [Brachionus plicatilis]